MAGFNLKNSLKVAKFDEKKAAEAKKGEPKPKNEVVAKRTKGLPDPHSAYVDMFKYDKRVRLHFEVPEVLKDGFLDLARKIHKEDKSLGLVDKSGEVQQKRFLYYCLRKAGMDIPDSDLLDARVRIRK